MPRISAGLLLYQWSDGELRVLLGHPGGPYFANKDDAIWTIPKGLVEPEEDLLSAARREFAEETGLEPPAPSSEHVYLDLGEMRYKNGKRVQAWAFEGDCDPQRLVSNSFEIEWPPRSGEKAAFPELDRFALFDMEAALLKAHPAQWILLQRLLKALSPRRPT
jgi:predicted NUDIX family NTP pyrophosphohydrolase